MNWDTHEGQVGRARRSHQSPNGAKLTDDDLKLVRGKLGELVGRLQKRYGLAPAMRAEKQVDDLIKRHPPPVRR